jgi:D-alanyl-D-alanine carboxypeptidase/D-alanyl-D-alanine-endopeptidase (penicillin-binding protein 4)
LSSLAYVNGQAKSRRHRRRTLTAVTSALAAAVGLSLPSITAVEAAPGGGTLEPQVLTVAEPLDPSAPTPSQTQIAALAAAHLDAAHVGAASVSVRDLTSQNELFAANPSGSLAPASTLKILTATAALEVMGPGTTLTTTAVFARKDSTSGTVTLVAGGDTMLAPRQGLPGQVMGRAGIGDLAWQAAVELRRQGTETVRVQLDDKIFSGPAVHADWGWSSTTTWGAPTAPLAIMGGRAGNAFDGKTYVADPALTAAGQFSRLLAQYGRDASLGLPLLAVTGQVSRSGAPPGAKQIAVVESAPVRDLVTHLLRESDNTASEALGRMTAVTAGQPGSFTGCTTTVRQALTDLGVPTTGLVMDDCSGLSHSSAVSAATLTATLGLAARPDAGELGTVSRSLPVGGLQGTLTSRFNETAAAGNVRAKTGTLTGVTSLAGIVQTTSGRALIFAVVANPGTSIWTDSARASIDRFVTGLAGLA